MWAATSEAQAVLMFTTTATIVQDHRSHLIHESHARSLAGRSALGRPRWARLPRIRIGPADEPRPATC